LDHRANHLETSSLKTMKMCYSKTCKNFYRCQ